MLISQVTTGGYGPPVASAPTGHPVAVSPPATPPAAPVELPAKAVQPADAAIKKEQLEDAVNQANKVVQTMTSDVKFTVDSETGIHVVKVIDTQTDEVIRQFPSEEMVDLAKSLDKLRGLIIRQKA